MGAFAGLVAGSGLLLVWWSCWPSLGHEHAATSTGSALPEALQRWGRQGSRRGRMPMLCVAAGVTTGVLVLLMSGAPVLSGCVAVASAWVPSEVNRHLTRCRRDGRRGEWPEAVDHLASGVRAGLTLPEALAQLGERGPGGLRPAFRRFTDDYRATGRFDEALYELREHLDDPVADRLVEAVRLAREVGGSDVGRVLRTLSAFLRDEARTRGELEVRQSWTVGAARLAVVAPWAVLAVLAARPEAVAAYGRPEGAVVLVAGGIVSLVAFRLMLRVGRLPEERRVLR